MIWILLLAVSFNLVNLYPEVAVDVIDVNDSGMHLLLTDLAVRSITHGQDFTDPWQGTMGMGFPVFHYYQHLPHVSVALVHVFTLGVFPLSDMVNWATYLLASFFPLSIYWSMRRFGFDRLSSAMGGLVASLPATNFLYGLGFTSYVWHGQGLYPQLWAMVLLPPALALGYRVLLEGRGYFWATVLLASTLMSHLIYGYMAFVTLGVLTLVQNIRPLSSKAVLEAVWRRWRRLIILFLLVVAVTSYFLVPFFLDRPYFNNSVWYAEHWFTSYGHIRVLRALFRGDLFDFERFPSLTILIAAGMVICLRRWREQRYLIPVAIFSLWLMLYFGRPTWGSLMDLLPMSRDLPIHRFISGVHLGGIYLAAIALALPWRWAVSRGTPAFLVVPIVITILILTPAYGERESYLDINASGMRENQIAMAAEDQDLSALSERLKQLPPGRVYAGLIENWGSRYRVGFTAVYVFLQAEGLAMMGSNYHGMSLTSDLEVIFDESRHEQYNLYNVRYVVAPEERKFPEFVRPLQLFGRHRLYEVDTTGYFDLVGSNLSFAGDKTEFFRGSSIWLASGLPRVKQYPTVLFGRSAGKYENLEPLSAAEEVIPKVKASAGPARGKVLSEEVGINYFVADVTVERESLLVLKVTYHPNWRATVDGVDANTVMLMPSFVGVYLSPGDHHVRLEYRPRRLRLVLLILGFLLLPLIAVGESRGGALASGFIVRVLRPVANSVKRRHL